MIKDEITKTDMINIKDYVEATIDMNPDKGIITATTEACDFHGIIVNKVEVIEIVNKLIED